MNSLDFRIALAGPRERSDVLALLAEYLPGTDVVHRHRWLYEHNPHGRAVTVVGYDPEGTPAGVTSVFPRRVKVKRDIRLGSIGGDGYVRPSFRRRGLATALHRACLAAMRATGIEFMYGPPEPYNLRALVSAGARIVTRVRRFAVPTPLTRLVRGFVRSRLRLDPIDGCDARVARVWDEAAELASVVPVRDPAFYAWRFGNTPRDVQRAFVVIDGGRPIGLCALERRNDRAAIVDLFGPAARYAQLARAIEVACEASSFELALNDDGPGASAIWGAGLVRREAKEFQVLAPTDLADAAMLFDAQSWHYTWADGDVDQVL